MCGGIGSWVRQPQVFHGKWDPVSLLLKRCRPSNMLSSVFIMGVNMAKIAVDSVLLQDCIHIK